MADVVNRQHATHPLRDAATYDIRIHCLFTFLLHRNHVPLLISDVFWPQNVIVSDVNLKLNDAHFNAKLKEVLG